MNYDAIQSEKNETGVRFKAHFHGQHKFVGANFCCLSK